MQSMVKDAEVVELLGDIDIEMTSCNSTTKRRRSRSRSKSPRRISRVNANVKKAAIVSYNNDNMSSLFTSLYFKSTSMHHSSTILIYSLVLLMVSQSISFAWGFSPSWGSSSSSSSSSSAKPFSESLTIAFQRNAMSSSNTLTYLNMGFKLDIGDDDDDDEEGKGGGLTFEENAPRIYFRAKKKHEVQVEMSNDALSNKRSLLHYLALPAEQYSVLDAGTIRKKDDTEASNMFTCSVDPIQFLGSTLEASIDAVVDVSDYPKGKSVIRVIGCTLSGSRLAKLANGRFDVDCTNVVRALPSNENGTSKSRFGRLKDSVVSSVTKNDQNDDGTATNGVDSTNGSNSVDEVTDILCVECSLEISALVPNEGKWLPKRLVGKSGSVVMQSLLGVLVPRFVEQLAIDYNKWSLGDDSRSPVAGTKEKQIVTVVDGDDIDSDDESTIKEEVEVNMMKINGSRKKKKSNDKAAKEHEHV